MRVMNAQREIGLLQRRREKYLDMVTQISGACASQVHGSGAHSRTEAAALRLVEIADRLGNAAERYAQLVRDAEGLIARLERHRHRQVLTLRYIECKSWPEITRIMGYQDEKSVFRVHGWALKAAQKLLDDV